MKHRYLPILVLALALGAGALGGGVRLVRISAADAHAAPAAASAATLLVLLPASALAVADESAFGRLQEAGIQVEILGDFDPERPLYLVRARTAADLEILMRIGSARALEGETVLFQPWNDQPARDIIPPRLALRALSPLPWPPADTPPAAIPERLAEMPLAADPLITQLIGEVSTSRLTAHIQALQDFGTRKANNYNNGCYLAGEYIHNAFTASGVSAEFDPFTFSSYDTRNIIAVRPGALHPEKVVILCGHYDSTSYTTGQAPGADDNASGTAAVLEAAHLFAGRTFDYTVKFAAFSAEEYGLYGSAHYAAAAQSAGEQIVGVINMDMIGFLDPYEPEDLDLVGKAGSEWLWQTFLDIGPLYVTMAYEAGNTGETWSDHASFWNRGYNAICAIEDREDTNPYYHTKNDLIGTLNFDFLTRSAKACIAVTAHLAGPLPSPGDLNRDGLLTAADFGLLAQYLAGNETQLPAGGGSPDLDGNDEVNAADLARLQHAAVD